jgi:hypothetical protein
MSTGQTLLTLGALVLMSFTVLNVLRTTGANEDIYNDTRLKLEAIALTTSMIEEASQMPYDEVCWDSTNMSKNLNDFTNPASLGPDAGETSLATFDDFDDFRGYADIETTLQTIYNITCSVDYVTENNPNTPVLTKTYYKRLLITSTNPITPDTLRLSYIHGYWYFN